MDRKKKLTLAIIYGILILSITGTFAYLMWIRKIGRLVLTIGDLSTTEVNVSPYLIEGSFSPVLTYEGEEYSSIRIINNESITKKIIVYYEVLNIDSALNSNNMKYTITKSSTQDGEYIEYSSGNFASVSSGDKIEILNEEVLNNTQCYYRVYLWIDGSSEDQSSMIGKNIKLEITAEISNFTGADMLIKESNPSTLSYSDATDEEKGKMWTFSHDATEQTEALTDYRYIGNSPNNYINFNDEVWRIIGVFDGRIKIIKDTSLGKMPYDYKQSGVGSSTSSYGSNNWTDAQLMYAINNNFLSTDNDILKTGYTYNETYIYDSSGNIIYKNGCKPTSIEVEASSYSCTAFSWTLNQTALSQIDKVTYYLGGTDTSSEKNAVEWYSAERSSTVYSGNSINWNGYVGLMYASDYGYTFSNGVNDTCYNDLNNCSNGTPSSSWLYDSSSYQWLMALSSYYKSHTFSVYDSGELYSSGNRVYRSYGVRPVVYLKSDTILQGAGTSSNPYTMQGPTTTKDLIKKSNPSTLSYSDATDSQKGEMWTFSHTAVEQAEALTDYRYIGSSPNNYITFNNETWRIIGVFDGRIKIMKDTATSLSWDYKQSGLGSSTSDYGSSDWTDSQLMYALNNNYLGTDDTLLKSGYTFDGTYVYNSGGNIIYKKGCKPATITTSDTSYSCTKFSWTLNSTALNQIDKVTYYLGGTGTPSEKKADDWYSSERSSTIYSGRPINWSGYVGLLYISDYGYTFAFGIDDICYNNIRICNEENAATPTSSWLYSSNSEWLMTPNSSYDNRIFNMSIYGQINYSKVYASFSARPVVYLKSSTLLLGTGTSSNPYTIVT